MIIKNTWKFVSCSGYIRNIYIYIYIRIDVIYTLFIPSRKYCLQFGCKLWQTCFYLVIVYQVILYHIFFFSYNKYHLICFKLTWNIRWLRIFSWRCWMLRNIWFIIAMWKTLGLLLFQLEINIRKNVRLIESNKKLINAELLLLFNETCMNENILPRYTDIDTFKYILIYNMCIGTENGI